jgi:hypothetical protein
MDRRLQRRFEILVQEHLHVASGLANGLSALPGAGKAFASTQAAWRFFNNEAVTLEGLIQPLQEAGRLALSAGDADWALIVHDWSTISYGDHDSKKDRARLTHQHDVGYELSTALLVEAGKGCPLAPMELRLRAARAVHSTRQPAPRKSAKRLDQLLPTMEASRSWNLSRPVVHVIDREADSVGHFREWHAAGHHFLVRADDVRTVRWNDQKYALPAIVKKLEKQGVFRETRTVLYHGREAQQWVAETMVVLDRAAKRRTRNGRKMIPGPPLSLRLIVSQVRDADGKLLAQWLLFTNLPQEITADRVALWYYWRWRIESYFKLLKSAGQNLEDWRQTSAAAIARRLLVASMACVAVWLLAHDDSPLAEEFRLLLVRLSGRQMKWGRPWTEPAMLAGMWTLLAMLDLLEYHDLKYLRRLTAKFIPFSDTS